jgi:hypothetical protein
LKALDSAKELWRQTDLLPEQLGKTTSAETSLSGYAIYPTDAGYTRELFKRILHGGIQSHALVYPSQQRDFKHLKLPGQLAFGTQPIAQGARHRAPDHVEGNVLVAKRIRRAV